MPRARVFEMSVSTDAEGPLRTLEVRVASFQEAMRDVLQIVRAAARQQWESPRGWKSTSETTQNTSPLVRTGALKESMMGGQGVVAIAEKTRMKFGTSVWYAIFAQSGTPTEPKRDIFGLTPTVKKKMRVVIADHLNRGVTDEYAGTQRYPTKKLA